MATTLNKLSALLDDSLDKPAFEHGVACHFIALKCPSLLERMNIGSAKAKTTVSVQINTGVITLTHMQSTTTLSACDLHIRLHNKKDVFLIHSGYEAIPYTFESRLFAVEFMGAVHLIQHIEALKFASALPDISHDIMLKEQLHCTLEFAREMWCLALWNQLYPYSSLVTSLETAVESLKCSDLEHIYRHLNSIYQQFYMHTSITKVADGSIELYYRASHITLLVAKIKALLIHVSLYRS